MIPTSRNLEEAGLLTGEVYVARYKYMGVNYIVIPKDFLIYNQTNLRCALGKQDVSFATSLLESRLIYGSEENFNLFQTKLIQTKTWNSEDFFLAKTQEQDLRHKKCHGTTYNLEPNLKENPGGLRDIQTIIWVAKKHFKSQSLSDLITDGYLTYEEHQELLECLLNLWNIRFALHLASGRAENRLLFDHQPLAAELLGFGSDGKSLCRAYDETTL